MLLMKKLSSRYKCHFSSYILIFILLCYLGGFVGLNIPSAYASAITGYHSTASCGTVAAPTNQSLLVVLLDRSGSLTTQPGATDPNGYSTSVTKALADLWPGSMAVIPFSKDIAPVLGPAILSRPDQQADLKTKIENYPIGGNTPLAPAMQQALEVLQQQQFPKGSRVVVITDGTPQGSGNNAGPDQEQLIRDTLLPQFCEQHIPASTFGLTITNTDANTLLMDIAERTGTVYTNVKGPEDLAHEVISLYAQWQGLTFIPVLVGQGGNYPVSIDPFVTQATIVSFHSSQIYKTTLVGPDGQPITQEIEQSIDRHYEIDNFNVSGVILPGNYVVNTGEDSDAQVYALVKSPLQIQLVQPTMTTQAYVDQPVQIEVQFVNGTAKVTPGAGTAQVEAHVTLLVNGQPVKSATNTIELTQQKNLENIPVEVGAIDNPYVPGSTLRLDDPLFVGRYDLIEQLKRALSREGSRSTFLLTGERRMGKTSTLKQLPKTLGSHYRSLMFDLQSPGLLAGIDIFFNVLAKDICDLLKKDGLKLRRLEFDDLRAALVKEGEKAVYFRFGKWFETVIELLEEKDQTLLLAFDEFEKLKDVEVKKQFNLEYLLDWFRSTIQGSSRVAFLFCGLRDFNEMGKIWVDHFVNVQTLKVSFLQSEEAEKLIIRPPIENFPGEETFSQEIVQEIKRLTHCHPFLLQAMCSEIITILNAHKQMHATIQDVAFAGEQVLSHFSPYFHDLWYRSSQEQKACLEYIQSHKSAQIHTIAKEIDESGISAKKILDTLIKRDLVLKNGDMYELAIPLFEQWIVKEKEY